MDKNVKAMLKINDVLDDRYKKLCDRYPELELSHNRKKKALSKFLKLCEDQIEYISKLSKYGLYADLNYLVVKDLCEFALFSDGRVNWRIKK